MFKKWVEITETTAYNGASTIMFKQINALGIHKIIDFNGLFRAVEL